MIVKNEETNLERCLLSLDLLRQKIDSELIIVDTGSIDNTVEIARKYTDKVYFHEWNNNFSDMRNISLEYGTGEWVFIIDADEQLNHPEEIIKYFQDDSQLLKYNTILLPMKDFTKSSDANSFFEYISPRFFKNDGTFRYEGSIHNQPMYKEPSLVIADACLYHFGYDSENEALIARKVERTSKMLIEALKKDPEDIYYRYQLSAIYRMGKQYELSFAEIERAYRSIPINQWDAYGYVISHYGLLLKDLGRDDEIIKLEETLEGKMNFGIDLSFIIAEAYYLSKRELRAKKYYIQYLELLNQYRSGVLKQNDISEAVITVNKEPMVLTRLVEICDKNKDDEGVIDFYQKIKIEEYSEDIISKVVYAAINLRQFSLIEQMVTQLKNQDYLLKNSLIRAVENYNLDHTQMSTGMISSIVKILNPAYEILLLARDVYGNNQKIQTDELIRFYESYFTIKDIYYADFLYFALKNGANIFEVLAAQSNEEIESIAEYLCENYLDFKTLSIEMIAQNRVFYALRPIACVEFIILKISNLNEQEESIGFDLLLNKIEWLYHIYLTDRIENRPDLLSGSDVYFGWINTFIIGNTKLAEVEKRLPIEKEPLWGFLLKLAVENQTPLLQEVDQIRFGNSKA